MRGRRRRPPRPRIPEPPRHVMVAVILSFPSSLRHFAPEVEKAAAEKDLFVCVFLVSIRRMTIPAISSAFLMKRRRWRWLSSSFFDLVWILWGIIQQRNFGHNRKQKALSAAATTVLLFVVCEVVRLKLSLSPETTTWTFSSPPPPVCMLSVLHPASLLAGVDHCYLPLGRRMHRLSLVRGCGRRRGGGPTSYATEQGRITSDHHSANANVL